VELVAGLLREVLEVGVPEVGGEREGHEFSSGLVVVPIKRRLQTRRQEPQR
jgi:hypothetical protein